MFPIILLLQIITVSLEFLGKDIFNISPFALLVPLTLLFFLTLGLSLLQAIRYFVQRGTDAELKPTIKYFYGLLTFVLFSVLSAGIELLIPHGQQISYMTYIVLPLSVWLVYGVYILMQERK
jgi:hypothetical protein